MAAGIPLRIMISCGEPSGDLYAGALASEILALEPDAIVSGFGGERMQAGGATLLRDFRGLSPKSFDGGGNYTIGIKEHIVFPEIDYDKAADVWGMDITVCTSAKSDAEARALLSAFNFPFRQ